MLKRFVCVFALAAVSVLTASAGDIVDTAVSAGSFQGLVDVLKGAGPFTVFAPSDEAFAKLPAGTVEGLLKNPEKLKKVLTYHVVAGKVMASDVAGMSSVKTVQGSEARITAEGGAVKIDAAKVIKADIVCDNGVIHVIDQVILPKE
jgi:uncharacterized surface protein with fasciclin (FAS1) repeats